MVRRFFIASLPEIRILKGMKLIRKKSFSGLGLFAGEPIKKKTFIIEYTGEAISHAEADRRGGKYLFEINSKITIDGKGRENLARYINHSHRPNAEVDIKKGKILISAIKDINVGDEITYDYGKEYVKEYCTPCKCDYCRTKKPKAKKKPARPRGGVAKK
jgi:SET domain-containing protein